MNATEGPVPALKILTIPIGIKYYASITAPSYVVPDPSGVFALSRCRLRRRYRLAVAEGISSCQNRGDTRHDTHLLEARPAFVPASPPRTT